MKSETSHYEIDMTHGPMLKKILLFALPLMATGMLQLLYNAADIAVVGKFATDADQAAVGSTGALINLVVTLFIGLSVGASVAVSNHYGAGRHREVSSVVHTAVAVSAIAGVAAAALGIAFAPLLMRMTGTPPEVEGKALAYLMIYFAGLPAAMVYNFGAAVLRAVGDTRRPMYYLAIAGVTNVVLNLISVIVFRMGASGVALATTVSQVVSAVLVVTCLMRSSGSIRLDLKKLRVHRAAFWEIARVGVPAGLQGTVFSISNVLIQSSVNSFGTIVMAGNTVAQSLDGFVNVTTAAFGQSALSFVAQNRGAGDLKRVRRAVQASCLWMAIFAVAVGTLIVSIGSWLLGTFYTDNPVVIEQAMVRLNIMCLTYALCGLMDVLASSIRGMGHSLLPMLVTLIGVCGLRIVWLYTVFAQHRTLTTLYLCYPVTWAIAAATHLACFVWLYRRMSRPPVRA
ncbi:MATE family efflux transporter [Bacillota bacterium Meth-B3]|nr:MATE family efflux transporter [Christensenellaceae bacterium]MEA5064856.1 MATE family efflux transporter [Eubacteriales bacterium]